MTWTKNILYNKILPLPQPPFLLWMPTASLMVIGFRDEPLDNQAGGGKRTDLFDKKVVLNPNEK
jgi:hypothetical protein